MPTARALRGATHLAVAQIVALIVLTACGNQTVEPRDDPDSPILESSAPPEPSVDGPVEHREIAVLSASNVGGGSVTDLVVLADAAAVDTWVSQFSAEPFREQVRRAVEQESPGPQTDDQAIVASVLSIGCETPADWSLERHDGELRVEVRMPKQTVQCLVPVTTVAVLAVEAKETLGIAVPD